MTVPESPRTKEQVLSEIGDLVGSIQVTFNGLKGLHDAQARAEAILENELPRYVELLVNLAEIIGPEEALKATGENLVRRVWVYTGGRHGGTVTTNLNESPIVTRALLAYAIKAKTTPAPSTHSADLTDVVSSTGKDARDVIN